MKPSRTVLLPSIFPLSEMVFELIVSAALETITGVDSLSVSGELLLLRHPQININMMKTVVVYLVLIPADFGSICM